MDQVYTAICRTSTLNTYFELDVANYAALVRDIAHPHAPVELLHMQHHCLNHSSLEPC
jgi:hypothetical protein